MELDRITNVHRAYRNTPFSFSEKCGEQLAYANMPAFSKKGKATAPPFFEVLN